MLRFNRNTKDLAVVNKRIEKITTNEEKVVHILERFFSVESKTWLQFKSYLDTLIAQKQPVEKLIPAANLLISAGLEKLRESLDQLGVAEIQADTRKDQGRLVITLTIKFVSGTKASLNLLQ